MKASTKKLTTAAVCTALAVIMCVFTAYLPLSFMPLFVAAFCIFLASKRGSLPYGILCALASIGLMFLMTGLSVKWLAFVLMFAPYGIITVFVHRFDYFKWKTALLRLLSAVVFFNVTFGIVYVVTVNVLSVGSEGLNIVEWASMVGGYPVLALIATAVLVPLDFIFSTMSIAVLKKIPPPVTRRKPQALQRPSGDETAPDAPGEKNEAKKYDDVFGYEIVDSNDRSEDRNAKDKEDKN